jgi:hypothetical protein
MTEKQLLLWIFQNLGPMQRQALDIVNEKTPGCIYTTDLLSAMTYREVHVLLRRYIDAGMKPKDIWPIIKGDYSKREGESEKQYHGFGVMQIDIGSFPAFVKSGDWKDPVKTYVMAMRVLEGKRAYLKGKFPDLPNDELLYASVCAYNCGEGNVRKILEGKIKDKDGKVVTDPNYTTHGRDYGREVFRLKDLYNTIPEVTG